MRKTVLAVAAAALLAGAGAASLPQFASAQPVAGSPPAPAEAAPGPGPAPGAPGPWMRQGPMMGGRMMEGSMWRDAAPGRPEMRARHEFIEHMVRTWGLFHRPADLGLSPADVQTIAAAILLRNGQHEWKVGEVTPNADHTVSFAFVTAHGDVIARFSMDTRSGRLTRTD